MIGIVITSRGIWNWVRTEHGEIYPCRLFGKFRMKEIKTTNPIAVGDRVVFELEFCQKKGLIKEIKQRENLIVRKSVNLSRQSHIIATNIDLVFLMITLRNPETTTVFIDRILAAAQSYQIESVLLFNKVDTYSNQDEEDSKALRYLYKKIGYEVIDISAVTQINLHLVKEKMKDKVSLFVGHSGVGKSTLINVLDSNFNLKTKEISERYQSGQHTTTFAQMYPLFFGGYIIDTPGIKGFGLVDFNKYELTDYFPEFFALKIKCKFSDCLHLDEPDCAVKSALKNQEISKSRYRNYVQLVKGEDQAYRKTNFNKDF